MIKRYALLTFLISAIFGGNLFFISSIPLQAQEDVPSEQADEEIVIPEIPLRAVAGEDKNVIVGRQVLFSAAATTAPRDQPLQYAWDFGDGRSGAGVDVPHVYTRSGVYRVTLTVSLNGQISTDEIIVSVDNDISLLITDASVSAETRKQMIIQARSQGTLLVDLHVDEEGNEYQSEANLVQTIIDNRDSIAQASTITLWTKNNAGVNALITASQALTDTTALESFGFQNKKIFILTDKSLLTTSRLAQNIYSLVRPKVLFLATPEAAEYITVDSDLNDVVAQMREHNISYQILGVHTQRELEQLKPWNFLSFIVNFMVNNGVPVNTIYLLLVLPVLATIIAFARQVIGIKAFGIYAPSLVAVSFIATGLKYGLAIFLLVLVIGTLSRLIAKKTKLMYLPRMAIVLTLVSLSILALFFIGAYLQKTALISISIFPILIMVIITEKFVSAQIEKGNKAAGRLILETIALSIICYYVATWESFRVLLVGYPELVFLTVILNFVVGRWVGLRLLELYRFRKILKHVQVTEKK